MAKQTERRKTRSSFRGEAANLYLAALARRHGLRAAVLADEQGLPIASTGPSIAEDPLSAYGAFRLRQLDPAEPRPPTAGPRSVSFQLGAQSVALTVLGRTELPLADVTGALRRILAF